MYDAAGPAKVLPPWQGTCASLFGDQRLIIRGGAKSEERSANHSRTLAAHDLRRKLGTRATHSYKTGCRRSALSPITWAAPVYRLDAARPDTVRPSNGWAWCQLQVTIPGGHNVHRLWH